VCLLEGVIKLETKKDQNNLFEVVDLYSIATEEKWKILNSNRNERNFMAQKETSEKRKKYGDFAW